ncbi:MAG: tRNA pseudouridine(38-40) synthase TruA [Steroidobacteraceae bacterium]
MRRYAAAIEYDGGAYSGWQSQADAPSVQQVLQAALSQVGDEPIHCTVAGRTDAGVHAFGQVVHFDTAARRSLRGWTLGLNSALPPDITVRWVRPVPGHFHARYSALARTYRYLLLCRATRPAIARQYFWWLRDGLDCDAMREAAAHCLGEHDFSALRAAECQAASPVRRVDRIAVDGRGEWVSVVVTANAFVQHMMRNLVGLLVAVGQGRERSDCVHGLLASRDRRLAPPTAPACGLALQAVHYPAAFRLPEARDFRSLQSAIMQP